MAEIVIKTGKEHMDVKEIHRFLSEESYWAKGIPYALVNHSLTHSFCIGAFADDKQIGFARVITDYHTFGWLADVYVLPEYRGKGISKTIMAHLMAQPWAKRLRRLMLNTKDAHGLYRQFQFTDLANPAYVMEVHRPNAHLEYREE
ncbi:GNAT family N-acetyltransferase [Mucilaginibacter sp. X4EP1]|uniref:GNAT family N-acetyltransferase n=1 Tax=Mucilaginibacter sp. X4EP1 TaxID=2723092 RepID=UPI0021681E09|nr:GNAT family N-acetyltransferase [Mucilaginibacter sp. X4EP1]MCS3813420.1 N-acetylglutamate synthase-like GNAT family acetyltransferase [Mucilaginibacter sp. X4EP1]